MKSALEQAIIDEAAIAELWLSSFAEVMQDKTAPSLGDCVERNSEFLTLRDAFDEALGVVRDPRKSVRSDHE